MFSPSVRVFSVTSEWMTVFFFRSLKFPSRTPRPSLNPLPPSRPHLFLFACDSVFNFRRHRHSRDKWHTMGIQLNAFGSVCFCFVLIQRIYMLICCILINFKHLFPAQLSLWTHAKVVMWTMGVRGGSGSGSGESVRNGYERYQPFSLWQW